MIPEAIAGHNSAPIPLLPRPAFQPRPQGFSLREKPWGRGCQLLLFAGEDGKMMSMKIKYSVCDK